MASAPHPGEVVCTMSGLVFDARGARWLDVPRLQIRAGERIVILGANGAGKSLLLRLSHGLLEAAPGRVEWSSPRTRAAQAMVFQRPTLLRRSSLANVAYPLRVRGISRRAAAERARAALAAVGLADFAALPARTLSVGEQQRVALAQAIALEPRLLWLDEPTASLDPPATRVIEDGVLALNARGCTIVMSTHDVGQAHRLATRVLFMHRGKITADQPADDFFRAPANEMARGFLAGELLA